MKMEKTIDGERCILEMDCDAIVAYEIEHPDWSIVKAISEASNNRISDMDRLTSFLRKNGENLGEDYLGFLKQGFTIDDMQTAFRDGLTMLGFISGADPSAE